MIDALTLVAPMPHADALGAGHVISIAPDGSVEWQSLKRLAVEGSWATNLLVRTCTHTPDRCTHVRIEGNPVKWIQGHNLWGTDDVPGLAVETLERVSRVLGISVSDDTRAQWFRGDVQLQRVDITESFHLGNRAEVLAWLRAAEQTAHLAHRGRGQLTKGSTLYFGKNSRRSTLKLYAKGQEITTKGHGQDAILHLPHAVAWADRTLRAELTLRSMELKRLGLDHVRDWLPVDGVPFAWPAQLLRDRLGDMTMTTTRTLPEDVLSSLSSGQHNAYLAWRAGADLRETMSRPSFYRLRSKLLKHGIDIATLLPSDVSNVVPLHRTLEAKPATVPDWAMGTPLYFEPRRLRVA